MLRWWGGMDAYMDHAWLQQLSLQQQSHHEGKCQMRNGGNMVHRRGEMLFKEAAYCAPAEGSVQVL
jgi:hypothetical protein